MHISTAEIFFVLTLAATLLAAALGRRHGGNLRGTGISNQRLNKWLIGLSAGATANTGFVVTAAVGIGYTDGLRWIMLPLAWLLGDIVFWTVFPQRMNEVGRRLGATTITELLSNDLRGNIRFIVRITTSLIVVACLSLYLSAQWISGQKFLAGAFGVSGLVALSLFAILIIAYTAIGGFRGSVYADSFQAVLRAIATIVILAVAAVFIANDTVTFKTNLVAAGPAFLDLLPPNAVGFVLGFACAGLGFGLGQPQVVTRYLAGASPQETQSAWWIYIAFVQFTWIAMTIFGVILRGIMPGLTDPEAGLSAFFQEHITGLLLGIIVADIFATIAAASNSILVSIAQAIVHDLVPRRLRGDAPDLHLPWVIVGIGAITMAVSLAVSGQHLVLNIVLSAVSFMGAAFAAPVAIKVLGLRSTGISLLLASLAGLLSAIIWKWYGLNSVVNEAFPGMAIGFLVHMSVAMVSSRPSSDNRDSTGALF